MSNPGRRVVCSFEETWYGKACGTDVVVVRHGTPRDVKGCLTDVSVLLERRVGRKRRAPVTLEMKVDRSKTQGSRGRLRVTFGGKTHTVARLAAFAYGNVPNLTWEEFNFEGSYTLAGTKCTGYLYQADHLAGPDGRKDPSSAFTQYLRVTKTVENWTQR